MWARFVSIWGSDLRLQEMYPNGRMIVKYVRCEGSSPDLPPLGFSSELFIVTAPFIPVWTPHQPLFSDAALVIGCSSPKHSGTRGNTLFFFFFPPSLSLKIIEGNLHTEYVPSRKLASGDKESGGTYKFYVTRGPQGRQSAEWKYIIIHNESRCCVSLAGLWVIFHVGNWMYCSGEGWRISFIMVPTKQKYTWMQK